mgnify:CR=1 FL=1
MNITDISQMVWTLNNKFNKKTNMKQDVDEDREWLSKEWKTTEFCFANIATINSQDQEWLSQERKTTRFWGAKQNVFNQTSLNVHIEPYQKG